jgi:hypothetical protein
MILTLRLYNVDANDELDDPDSEGPKKRPKRTKLCDDASVMYDNYDWYLHRFLAHLRRVHPDNPPISMKVDGIETPQVVKAADPFAKPDMPLYYFNSKTNLYNDIFFDCLDNIFALIFNIVCPWFNVDSMESLNRLFELEFEE